jgi:hypothetical protein
MFPECEREQCGSGIRRERRATPFFGHLPWYAVDMTSPLTFLSFSLAFAPESTRKSNVANEKKSISNPNSLSKRERERRGEKKQQKIHTDASMEKKKPEEH